MSDYIKRDDAINAVLGLAHLNGRVPTDSVIFQIKALPSTELPKGELISRADALQCKPEFLNPNPNDKPNNYPIGWNDAIKAWYADIKALPSADAEPTVIRAKTFMRKEDFDKWAEDIKKQGENVICIPCDAEVVSVDAVHGEWIPIEETLPTYDGGEKTWLSGMKCSNCGKLFDLRVGYYFCPNCGARMYTGEV